MMRLKGSGRNDKGLMSLSAEIELTAQELAEQLTQSDLEFMYNLKWGNKIQKECSCDKCEPFVSGGSGKYLCVNCGLPIPKAKYPCCSSAERNGEECPIHKERPKSESEEISINGSVVKQPKKWNEPTDEHTHLGLNPDGTSHYGKGKARDCKICNPPISEWKCQMAETYPNGDSKESCNKCCYYQDKKCVFGYETKEPISQRKVEKIKYNDDLYKDGNIQMCIDKLNEVISVINGV
jgi:hypothetical protein